MADVLNPQQFFHGSRARLNVGDLVEPGHDLAFGSGAPDSHVYFTPDRDVATNSAQEQMPRAGAQRPHLYEVEPTGDYDRDNAEPEFESYRSQSPLRVKRRYDVKDPY